MSTVSIALALLYCIADPGVATNSNRTLAEWQSAVRTQLREEAAATGPEHITAVKELITLHQQIGATSQLPPVARSRMQGRISSRLQRTAGRMGGADHGPELLELIEQTIAPDTWESVGGPGRIFYWRPGRAMVVSQTSETHEALADMLRQLHAQP